MKLVCLILLVLCTSVLNHTLKYPAMPSLQKYLHIRRLQEKEVLADDTSAPGSTKKSNFSPLTPPKITEDWIKIRENLYAAEKERLIRERAFHSAEFKRYVRLEKWWKDRQVIEDDKAKSIKTRVLELRDLDDQALIEIDTLNAQINLRQELRNPQNREKQRASRIFGEKQDSLIDGLNNTISNFPLTKQGVEDNGKLRILQAKAPTVYTAAQKKSIAELEAMWVKRRDALKNMIELNTKFHTTEFYEFAYDEHKLSDMKAIWESDSAGLSWSQKRSLWWVVGAKYRALKAPAKKIIDDNDNARNNAQDLVNKADREYNGIINKNGWFGWADK